MSAAFAIRLTAGYAQIPNSIIENQAAMTRAELALALIVLRRGGANENDGVLVSDRNWQSWTGLSPRLKEYAIRGLAGDEKAGIVGKGLEIHGRGERARYRFEYRNWESFVRNHRAEARPRTVGRKASVAPKVGSKIHPDCRERGCAMLAAERGETKSKLTLVSSAPIAQPVAQLDTARSGDNTRSGAGGDKYVIPDGTPLASTPTAQPVAQNDKTWADTLRTLREFFPLVGLAFLARLVAVVSALFSGLTDSELAQGVRLAWSHNRKRQHGEGLFLYTVPDAVRVIRSRSTSADSGLEIRKHLRSCVQLLRERGAPFVELAAELASVIETPGQLDSQNLRRIDRQVFQAAWLQLPAERRLQIIEIAQTEWKDAESRQACERHETLYFLDLPSVWMT
jgi:hypothetical protein